MPSVTFEQEEDHTWRWIDVPVPTSRPWLFLSPRFRYQYRDWYLQLSERGDDGVIHLSLHLSGSPNCFSPSTIFVQVRGCSDAGPDCSHFIPRVDDLGNPLGTIIWQKTTSEVEQIFPGFSQDRRLTFRIKVTKIKQDPQRVNYGSKRGKKFYDLLGVPVNATEHDIRKGYKKMALKYHPDKNNSPDAETKFKSILAAYQVLVDKDKRSKYDKSGDDPVNDNNYSWKNNFSNFNSRRGFFRPEAWNAPGDQWYGYTQGHSDRYGKHGHYGGGYGRGYRKYNYSGWNYGQGGSN